MPLLLLQSCQIIVVSEADCFEVFRMLQEGVLVIQ